jgi:uncharacterized protein involved in exopolysaccharide biosynthesis
MGVLMNTRNKEGLTYEDKVTLYDYWVIILKRKNLIIGLFLISVFLTTVISLLMPKIYRGEVILNVVNIAKKVETDTGLSMYPWPILIPGRSVTDTITSKQIIDIIGRIDDEKIRTILSKDPSNVQSIRITEVRGSLSALRVRVESKKREEIQDLLIEVSKYLENVPIIKRSVREHRARVNKQIEEASFLIREYEDFSKRVVNMAKKRELAILGFDPIDMNIKVSKLKVQRLELEQFLENITGIEVISEPSISKRPVKPKLMRSIIFAGLISLFVGIFLAFFMENKEKIRSGKKLEGN